MFTPTALEKGSYVGSENSSTIRGKISSRFPVAVSHLGDENQQFRIQLAVHKYNNSANSPPHTRRSFVSPVRHSFLKNSLKGKKSEDKAGQCVKIDKKSGNQYEGVGAFPTVHLKKNAIRYRPIRRFNEVKVPNPELPVNRFLSHLPELCPDLKSSTRSVLDVLQDLSRKKIHSKEEDEHNKSRAKGLGGDLVLSADVSYKPLFVQKPKVNEILTRDNTTQTLLSPNLSTVSSTGSNSSTSLTIQENLDPRAELRRKLAKQNNEIFASLSSSATSLSFPVKRKLDNVLQSTDKDSKDVLAVKKLKVYENHTNNHEEKSNLKGFNRNNYTIRLNWKSKLNETSCTSPNKDRLTSIFLDLQSTSPKTQIFQDNAEKGKGPFEIWGPEPSNSNKSGSQDYLNKIEDSLKKSSDLNFKAPATSVSEPERKESKVEGNKEAKSFLVRSTLVTTETAAQVKLPNRSSVMFGSHSTTNGNVSTRGSTLTNTSLSKSGGRENKDNESPSANKFIAFESLNEGVKAQTVGAFKFEVEGGVKSMQNQLSVLPSILNEPKNTESSLTNRITPNLTSQFTFNAKSTEAETLATSQSSGVLQFGQNISNSNSASSALKSAYTFGQSPLFSSLPGGSNKGGNNPTAAKRVSSLPATSESFSNGIPVLCPKATFAFGQNTGNIGLHKVDTKTDLDNKQNIGQNPETPPNLNQNSSVQCLITQARPSQTPSFLQSSTLQTSSNITSLGQSEPNPSITFGQKPAVSEVSSSSSSLPASSSGEQKPQPTFSFTFGQKFESKEMNKASETNLFGQKNSPSLFNFGPKVSSRESSPSSGGSTTTFCQPTNTQSGSKPPCHPLLFEQNSSQSSITPQTTTQPTTFSQFSNTEVSNVHGGKTETSFGKTSAFGQTTAGFPAKTNLFNSTDIIQTTSGFLVSSTNGFGAPVSTQSGFSASSATQSSAFGTPASTQSGFGIPVVTQSATAFGTPSSTQSATAFGTPSTQSAIAFGTPSTQSGTAFGTPSTQTINGFGRVANTQSSTLFPFGSTSSTQCTTGFGAPANPQPGFGLNSQISFGQTFGQSATKPTTSLEQPSNNFGQNSPSNRAFTSTTTFGTSGQNSIFGQKTESQSGVFGQNTKIQSSPFDANSRSFSPQNKFHFGMSKPSPTGFTTSPPNTTATSVFNFGASMPSQSTAYSFGNSSSVSANAPTPFSFKSSTNDAFKFATSTTKEGGGFGENNTSNFSFGAQINNSSIPETKTGGNGFSFGMGQTASSAPAYNFGSTPSPSVFSFGGTGSSANSGSSFNFGTPQSGVPFGQSSTPSQPPFSVPGTFSIGSGSSQSRPRASSRLRRRP